MNRPLWTCLLVVALAGCRKDEPPASPPERPLAASAPAPRPAGPSPIELEVEAAKAPPAAPPADQLGGPRSDLTPAELSAFETGRRFFLQPFSEKTGLGPYYNEVSCVSCHYGPVPGGAGDVAHGLMAAPHPFRDDTLLMHRHALPRFPAELQPKPGATIIRASPPPLFGLGLFEKVSDADIASHCGESAADGVHGHANVVQDGRTGRFGRTAVSATLRIFVMSALSDEIGITSPGLDPERAHDGDSVPDPEVSDAVVDSLAAFVGGLAPAPRQGSDPAGEAQFTQIGCALCHRPDLAPQARGAYTDLCLHHMGSALAHGIKEHAGSPDELRTVPLWGLRLKSTYLHDERAKTIADAIAAHGGEATRARERYEQLPADAKEHLLAFLHSL